MMSAHVIGCGCRPRTVKTRGHRPACLFFDPERAKSRRNLARFRRAVEAREYRFDHRPGVILAA